MSSELVPLSYAREAYNALHGTELQTHNDALTAEQAARINNHFDIELHLGTHGLASGEQSYDPYALIALPTQQEYKEAAAVVEGLRPGDTLFIEGYGFNSQPPEPVQVPDRLPLTTEKGSTFAQRMFGQLALTMAHEMKAEARRGLEQERHDYKISAWDYARQLAALKGVRTVVADHDVFEDQSLRALSKGRGLMELMRSPNKEDQALAERMHAQRERRARNMLKDWALDHLPPEGSPAQEGGHKPKLALLFGGAHREGLEQSFNDIGLKAEVTVMKSTDVQGRVGEQVVRVMSNAMAALMPSLIGAAGGSLAPVESPQNTADRQRTALRAAQANRGLQSTRFKGDLGRFSGRTGKGHPTHNQG
jgi:hypothetical protein